MRTVTGQQLEGFEDTALAAMIMAKDSVQEEMLSQRTLVWLAAMDGIVASGAGIELIM